MSQPSTQAENEPRTTRRVSLGMCRADQCRGMSPCRYRYGVHSEMFEMFEMFEMSEMSEMSERSWRAPGLSVGRVAPGVSRDLSRDLSAGLPWVRA